VSGGGGRAGEGKAGEGGVDGEKCSGKSQSGRWKEVGGVGMVQKGTKVREDRQVRWWESGRQKWQGHRAVRKWWEVSHLSVQKKGGWQWCGRRRVEVRVWQWYVVGGGCRREGARRQCEGGEG